MTTRGCMLVGYCKARRPTLKTADFADNVLVGHLVSNQPVTGGQTSSLSPPLCGAFLGQGHILVTAGRPYGESGTRELGRMLPVPPTAGSRVGCCGPPQPPRGWRIPRVPIWGLPWLANARGPVSSHGLAPSPALSLLSPGTLPFPQGLSATRRVSFNLPLEPAGCAERARQGHFEEAAGFNLPGRAVPVPVPWPRRERGAVGTQPPRRPPPPSARSCLPGAGALAAEGR